MRAGIAFLVVAYTLSQFYRAFLAVLSPVLEAEIGATTGDLARASGLWFAAFALMQLPVGWALDRLGPRRHGLQVCSSSAGRGVPPSSRWRRGPARSPPPWSSSASAARRS